MFFFLVNFEYLNIFCLVSDGVPDAMMQQSRSRKGAKQEKLSASKQHLKCWWHYCTAQDWGLLRNPKVSFNQKMTTMVERGMSVGCVDPDEQSLKWALATLLVVHYDELPSPHQVYQKLQDIKQSYIAERKPFLYQQLAQFPEDPQDLPLDIYAEAYPLPGGGPNKVVLQGVNTVADSIPLRSNSKLLRKKADRNEASEAFAQSKQAIKSEPQAPSANAQAATMRSSGEVPLPQDCRWTGCGAAFRTTRNCCLRFSRITPRSRSCSQSENTVCKNPCRS